MSIVDQCMVANLQIAVWQGYRLDEEASRKVTEQAEAASDAARVNKHLVPKSALAPVNLAAGRVRNHFYEQTLPWKDNGDRLLTRKQYMRFIETHERLCKAFEAAVAEFLSDSYIRVREQAAFRMGTLFKDSDYPEPRTLRKKFSINLDIDAVTEAGDFRVKLDQEHLEEVRAGMEQAMQRRLARATADIWRRLDETLSHFRETMASDNKFRNSTVNNVRDLVEAIDNLNVTGDPGLEHFRQQVRDRLSGFDPDTLRQHRTQRDIAATEAGKIIEEMKGFMRAFGQAA